uniref:Thioredoxin domain-containing protein n=1 Tax=Kalanchoe fedtschenkoi TaxID=63787 RepID=A0A7N0V1P4_KALFE
MMATTTTTTTAFLICFLIFISSTTEAASSPVCHLQPPNSWLTNLQSISPLNYYDDYSPLQEVNGDFLDQTVAKLGSGHIAVLFHAYWCPFSSEFRPIFETLSFMFPEIKHLTIEQSSALPSVLSRYGVHSFPAILIVNHSSSVRYHGARDLSSIIHFYKKTAGCEPVRYMTADDLMSLSSSGQSDTTLISSDSSLKGMLTREPYLAFSVLFIFLRLLHFILPWALACVKSLWRRFVIPQMNLEIFGETSQIFGRALHMIDVKRFWTKLKLCKTRNFHQRARSARVWASSIASVSVGEN